ncbi:MAG: sugar-binding transcriptional regulator [Balneolaceae bacterium]
MSRPVDPLDLRLISKVSSLYYHRDLNQQEIASRLQLSRPKVSRLLKRARELGIVQISVTLPENHFIDKEIRIEKKFRLKEVVIVEGEAAEDEHSVQALKRQLGVASATYLQRTLTGDETIGVTWGTTLQSMVESLNPTPAEDVHIVQTLGGVGPPEAKAHATDISRRLSGLFNCQLTLLPAPGIVDSKEARDILLADRRVKHTLGLFQNLTTAFVGIGALETNPVLAKGSHEISGELIQDILNSGAVGDIGLNFFGPDGQEIPTRFREQMIGITLKELKLTETVVGVAGGREKYRAILGALNGGHIDVLITDHHTADKLIEEP